MSKTLILGLGNPIRSDDAIGIIASKAIYLKVMQDEESKNVFYSEADFVGLKLLDIVEGYDRLLIIDSIVSNEHEHGDIIYLTLDDFVTTSRILSIHETDMKSTMELGKELKLKMPDQIKVVAVVIDKDQVFSDRLSKNMQERLPEIVSRIFQNCRDFLLT